MQLKVMGISIVLIVIGASMFEAQVNTLVTDTKLEKDFHKTQDTANLKPCWEQWADKYGDNEWHDICTEAPKQETKTEQIETLKVETNESRYEITKRVGGEHWKLVYAIGIHESGNYTSRLCNELNNCWGRKSVSGGWMRFPTFEDGVKDQADYLQRKYFSQGLITPQQINSIYAEDPTWWTKIEGYLKGIN